MISKRKWKNAFFKDIINIRTLLRARGETHFSIYNFFVEVKKVQLFPMVENILSSYVQYELL